jgi:hypothetical protein
VALDTTQNKNKKRTKKKQNKYNPKKNKKKIQRKKTKKTKKIRRPVSMATRAGKRSKGANFFTAISKPRARL